MTHWAFCENLSSDEVVVEDAEAHHLLHVMRLNVGDELTVFDGKGTEADAVVSAVTRRDVSCRILSRRQHAAPSRGRLTVFASPPKADRLKWMVEKLTEIGVERLVLLHTQRTVVTPGETRVDKLKASVIAACKQCRRPWVMDIQPLTPFSAAVQEATVADGSSVSCIAHPGQAPGIPVRFSESASSVSLLVGPEGGFTDAEFTAATDAGLKAVSWPGTILRIETAAIVFSSLLKSAQEPTMTG